MILVTGSSGFIGFHVAKKLLEMGKDIILLDNKNYKKHQKQLLEKLNTKLKLLYNLICLKTL